MASYKAVNNRLGQLLDSHNMTSPDLADRVHVSRRAMYNYVKGLRPLPIDVAYSIAQYFGVQIEYLYEWVLVEA